MIRFYHQVAAALTGLALITGCAAETGKNPNDEAVELSGELVEFIARVEDNCPCEMPAPKKNTPYSITPEEELFLEQSQAVFLEEGYDSKNNRKTQALALQELYYTASQIPEKSAEKYLLQTMENFSEYISALPAEKLIEMRNILISDIVSRKLIAEDFKKDLRPEFIEFLKAEIKALIQLRKSVIDEISAR
jgi:hypothetical protein